MADANVDLVDPDFDGADERLAQAKNHLESASLEGMDDSSRYILLYTAAHKATAAALLADGRRISAGDRAHQIQLKEAKKILGKDHVKLMDSLDTARQRRNKVQYEAAEVTAAMLQSLEKSAADAVDAAERFVAEKRA